MTTTKRTPLCGPYRAEGNTIKALDHGEWFTIARCDCKRLIPEGNAANAEFLASAPDLLRQRDKLREVLEQALTALRSAYAAAYCGPQPWTPEERESLRLQACDADATARAILAETEAKL